MNKYVKRIPVFLLFAGICDFLLTPKISPGPRSLTSFFVWLLAFFLLDYFMNNWNRPDFTHFAEMDDNDKLKRWAFTSSRFDLDLDFVSKTTKFRVYNPSWIKDQRKTGKKYDEDAKPSSISETVPTVRLLVGSRNQYDGDPLFKSPGWHIFNYSMLFNYGDPYTDSQVEYFHDLSISFDKVNAATHKQFQKLWPAAAARIAQLENERIEEILASRRSTGS